MTVSFAFLAAALAAPILAADAAPAPAAAPAAAPAMSEQQQTLYGIGLWLSQQAAVFRLTGAELKTVEAGLRDGVLGHKLQVDPSTVSPKLKAFVQQKVEKERAVGQALVEKAAKQPGAQKLADGAVYVSKKEGGGDSPKDADKATFKMRGSADGKVFDDTFKTGQPVEAMPTETGIDCLKEALELMKPGGSAQVVCPASAAFGDRGHPPEIPGGAAIVFDIELLKVAKGISSEQQKAALDKAAAEAGAEKLPDGVVYLALKKGTGASPKATDTVKVNYKGTLIDGKQFDANNGITFGLNQVIPCWTEGVQKMKVGGKAKLTCPAAAAYGEHGTGGIPGGATLIFEVDLLDVVKK